MGSETTILTIWEREKKYTIVPQMKVKLIEEGNLCPLLLWGRGAPSALNESKLAMFWYDFNFPMCMCVVSYNARVLRFGHRETDEWRRLVVDKLMDKCDVLCVQETFLAKQDLELLNCMRSDFRGAGESTSDLSANLLRETIPGGVATMW